jgi:hypothetical protein
VSSASSEGEGSAEALRCGLEEWEGGGVEVRRRGRLAGWLFIDDHGLTVDVV